jgi:hypothetical protein
MHGNGSQNSNVLVPMVWPILSRQSFCKKHLLAIDNGGPCEPPIQECLRDAMMALCGDKFVLVLVNETTHFFWNFILIQIQILNVFE